MQRFQFQFTLLAAAAVLLVSLSATAQPSRYGDSSQQGPPPSREGPAELFEQHADEIGLSDRTVQRIRQVFDDARVEMEFLHESLRNAESAARADGATENDRWAAEQAREQLDDARHSVMNDVRALMTDDQWQRAQELLPPPPEEGGRRGGPRGDRGDGDCGHQPPSSDSTSL